MGVVVGAARLCLVGDDTYPNWEAIYRDNVKRVYGMLYAKVGNRADAEDLTTEVFLAALRPLRTSASVGEVRAYLLAAARTALAGYWRRKLGLPVTTFDDATVDSVFPDEPASTTDRARVDAVLAQLPQRYQDILRLRFLDGCTVREAADELGLSVTNTKVLQHRALRRAAAVAERMTP
jgi:RNA polymerase sigma-70 factor (ECF subfamily)